MVSYHKLVDVAGSGKAAVTQQTCLLSHNEAEQAWPCDVKEQQHLHINQQCATCQAGCTSRYVQHCGRYGRSLTSYVLMSVQDGLLLIKSECKAEVTFET